MSKIVFRTLDNLQNEPTAIAVINQNFAALQTLADTLLSRDGAIPNQMVALLDMNGHKVINLPVPTTPTEPARHGDIQQYVDLAQAAAVSADLSADSADASEAQTLIYYTDFLSRYIGTYAANPSVDGLGNPLKEGAIYYNSVTDGLYIWAVREVYVDLNQVFVGVDEVHADGWVAMPINKLASMSDVAVFGVLNGQLLQWNTALSNWVPYTLDASTVPYTGSLTSTNVKAAIDEMVSKTLLNVYDLQFYLEGLMADAENLYRYAALRQFTVPSNTTGFIAVAGTAATATTVVTLKKNNVQFGTITWSAAGTVGVWSIPGDTVFNPGDLMSLVAPSSPDTTLKNVSIGMIVRR